jgi:hypothetical protein
MPDLNQTWILSTDCYGSPNTKFHVNPSIASRADTCGRTDGQTSMMKVTDAFSDYANATQNGTLNCINSFIRKTARSADGGGVGGGGGCTAARIVMLLYIRYRRVTTRNRKTKQVQPVTAIHVITYCTNILRTCTLVMYPIL